VDDLDCLVVDVVLASQTVQPGHFGTAGAGCYEIRASGRPLGRVDVDAHLLHVGPLPQSSFQPGFEGGTARS